MMTKFVAGVLALLCLTLSPVRANTQDAGQILSGILTQIITNEINKTTPQPPSPPAVQAPQPSQNANVVQEPAMSRETRQQVQAALNLLGFDAGVEDGVLGRGSRAAIRAYQVANGAPGTGYLTSIQLRDLTNTYAQALNDGNPQLSRPLSKQEFQQLQTALKTLGYYTGAIDGIVGRGTSQAIFRYANDRGIDANTVSTAQVLEMALDETTRGSASPSGTPGFLADFNSTGNRLTLGLENLDPGQTYWAILLDPRLQGAGVEQYFAYQTVTGGTGGQISFNLNGSEALAVWLQLAENGAPVLDKLTIREPASNPQGQVVEQNGIRVDFGQDMPIELTGEPISVTVSGLSLGPFYRVVIRESGPEAGTEGPVAWNDPNQGFSGTSRTLKIVMPRVGSFVFVLESMSTGDGYVPILEIPIEVVASASGDDIFRWVVASDFDGTYSPAQIKDDLFLGRYEGEFNCGPRTAEWYGSKIEVIVNKVTVSYGRVETFGHITIRSRDSNAVLFSAKAQAIGTQFTDRLLPLGAVVDQNTMKTEGVAPYIWSYKLQFDRAFTTATLTPTKSDVWTKTECPSSELTRTADSPLFIPGNPKAPHVADFCRDTSTAEGLGTCVEAAAKAWQTHEVLIAVNRLRDVVSATRNISPPQCSQMLENFDQVLFSITQEYGVPFGYQVKTCPQLLTVLDAMGYPRPAPKVCDVQRNITQDWMSSCLRALSENGHEAQVRTMLSKATNTCLNGPEGAIAGSTLFSVLASQRVFSGGDWDRQYARLKREADCRDVVRVAQEFGIGDATTVNEFIGVADAAEQYACSQERAETQPTRLDMIEALGREIARRCSPGFLTKSWLAGDGNDMTPFTAALFEFVPTEKSCQLRSRLSSIAAAPEFTIWAGGYESAQCQAKGSGRFDCVGDFETGFGSNDPRPGASVLSSLFVNKRNPLAVSFRFDQGACEWRAVDIRQVRAQP